MLRNYFKIGIRNLIKNKFYTLINIIGLAIGIACCLLIVLFVQDELSYDEHHPHAERLYRVVSDINFGGEHSQYAVASAPMAQTLVDEYPEVELAGRMRLNGSWLVKVTDEAGGSLTYKEDKFAFADSELLELLSIDLLEGQESSALSEPNSLIISKSHAQKYFGEENALGKMLLLDNKDSYMVKGVFEDIPKNTHFDFDILASMESLEESKEGIWLSHNFTTYLRLAENASSSTLEEKFPAMVEKYLYPQAASIMGLNTSEFATSPIKYFLQPVSDIHLYSHLQAELMPNGDIKYVYIFSAIAVFILLIACINFMNLSTARSAKRAKEVGIRKVLGSVKQQLVTQFLTESVLMGLMGLLLGIGLVEFFLPFFNNLSGKSLAVNYFENGEFIFAAIFLVLLIGFLAGAYPSFFLSSFEPARVLKGGLVKGSSNSKMLRSGLVIFQFSISVILIVGTLIIYKQLHYIQNKALGFNKEQVIVLHEADGLGDQIESFKDELLNDPQILNATISSFLPVYSDRNNNPFYKGSVPSKENSVSMQNWFVDDDYIETMGMQIVEGRGFLDGSIADSTSVILNESAVKKFGYKDPIGEKIFAFNFSKEKKESDALKSYTIIGVVKDFHFNSFRESITPLALFLGKSNGLISLRVQTDDTPALVAQVKEKWSQVSSGQPFDYEFLDSKFNHMYKSEERIADITMLFTTLAIFIACLGLFALAAFTSEQRTKEIGVRKILGASVSDVVLMLSIDFTKLIGIAILIAIPVSWMVMNSWLESFVYRISLNFETFLIAGGIAVFIAWLTISYQSIKAALADPVDSLRSD